MEIERKFLLEEKNKVYPSPFNTKKLKKEILENGKEITQNYIRKKYFSKIKNELNLDFNFKPNQFRLRKYNKMYFLTIKSKGIMTREEFEIKINKKTYDKYLKLKKKSLKKYRLEKKKKNFLFEFDYFPKHKILTVEIEFKTIKDAKKFKINAKEVTKIKKYGSKQLAK